jgi:DNA anti-recombination protein RmuC
VSIWSVLTWTVFYAAFAVILGLLIRFIIVTVLEHKASKSRIAEVNGLLDDAKSSRLQARRRAHEASDTVRKIWVEFDETLVDDLHEAKTRSTIEAEFFFNPRSLAGPLFENRWTQALPGTLIAVGVAGTFFKLTFGLKGLNLSGETDINHLQESVMTLLNAAGLSFLASGAGVVASLIATYVLSRLQNQTTQAINELVSQIDSYFERYSAEFGIQKVEQNTREIAQSLNELHEKIGVEFQKSVQGLSSDMQNAIIGAINVALAPAMENLTEATSRQSGEVFDSLVGRFSEAFEGMGQSQATAMKSASQDLVESVSSLSSQIGDTLGRIEKTTAESSQATSSGISQMLAAAQDQARQDRENHAAASAAAREQAEADRAAYAEVLAQLQTTSAESLARFKTEASEQTDVLQRQFGELAEAANDRQRSLETNIARLVELASQTQSLMETSAKSMAASSADLKSVAEGFSTTTRTVAGNLSEAVSSIQSVSQQQSLSLRALDQHSSAIDQITSHSTTAGERLAAAAHEAKTAFDEMREHQTEFLLGLGDSLDGAKTSLTQSIEQTAKKMAEWLAAYSDTVSSQTDERLNEWNKHSTEYASSMLQIAKSLEGVVDELEGVNKSGAYTRKAVLR